MEMTPEQRALYEAIILDHNTHPKNNHHLDAPTHHAEGYNPICGDRYHIYLQLEGDRIVAAAFEGHGCALSKASASIMTTHLTGLTVADAEVRFTAFHDLLLGHTPLPDDPEALGELAALMGVKRYPSRIKCVTLPWHALRGALRHEARVSTE